MLNANNYIDQYNISENGAFDIALDLGEEFSAEAELYVDRNQYGLYRLIRDIKNPKPQRENREPAPRIMRQRIAEARKQMDIEAEKEQKGSKEKKFSRFSPKKEVS